MVAAPTKLGDESFLQATQGDARVQLYHGNGRDPSEKFFLALRALGGYSVPTRYPVSRSIVSYLSFNFEIKSERDPREVTGHRSFGAGPRPTPG